MNLIHILAVTVSLNETVIPVLIAVISSGFLFGLIKILPERRSILVQASENAVRVVNEAIVSLQKELNESRAEILRLETELNVSVRERRAVQDELAQVQQKVYRLESELSIYLRLVQNTAGPVGPAGPTGIQGVHGDQGAQGVQGIQGEQGQIGPGS